MATLADLATKRVTPPPALPAGASVIDGKTFVPNPPIEQQYAPPPRIVAPPEPAGSDLAHLIDGYSMRVKVAGAVIHLQAKATATPAALIEALRVIDPAAEFDTELRREFGPRGEVKRGSLQMVTIESRNDKVAIGAIGSNATGASVRADNWLDKEKASELLAQLPLLEHEAQSAQAALDGKEVAVIPLMDRGSEFSYRENEKDGKVSRRLTEFHSGVKS